MGRLDKNIGKIKNRLIKFAGLENRVDMHGFEYTVRELVGMWENSENSLEWHGKILDQSIMEYKTSDTVFILGGGPSINHISESEWQHIGKHDSIGLNMWLVHDFIPSFYLFQLSSKGSANETILNLLRDRVYEYADVPFLVRGSAFAKGEFDHEDSRLNLLKQQPVYFVNEYPIHSRCSIDPEMLYRYAEALGFLEHGSIARFVPKWRCSLGLLLSLVFQMGYDKIVLCGFDMQDGKHFWDSEEYASMREYYNLPTESDTNLHTFTDESLSSNTVPRYVYTFRDWVSRKNGVQIFLMNKHSVLYPEIPVYKLP